MLLLRLPIRNHDAGGRSSGRMGHQLSPGVRVQVEMAYIQHGGMSTSHAAEAAVHKGYKGEHS